MGEKYNSYWGFQNGEKRNARVKNVEEPLFMLNHYFKIDSKTNLNSGVMYQFGEVGNSNIDYQNANSPDPVYYKKCQVILVRFMLKIKESFRVNLLQIMKMQKKQNSFFGQSADQLE